MPDAPVAFTMPSLGADMEAGTIVEWRVAPGSEVHRGDIVAVVETDKSDLEVEVFHDGVVLELLVPPGRKVAVGTPLALLRPTADGGRPAVPPVPAARDGDGVPPVPAVDGRGGAPPVRTAEGRHGAAPIVSPVLRHLAAELHVDPARVPGTGAGGRVTRDDLESFARRLRATPRARRLARRHGVDLAALAGSRPVSGADVLSVATASDVPPAPPRDAGPGPDTMRLAIARLMARSWREIPHYQVGTRLDVSATVAALAARNAERPVARRVLLAAVLAHAAARAVAEVPEVNGHWVDDELHVAPAVHLGVVVAVRTGGLLAPVIHDAAAKDLDTVMAELRDLVTRARRGRLRASEVAGATFTVTDLGEGSVERVVPIIHPPQVAILGLGSPHDEPWAQDAMVGVRTVVHATLAADHRAIDGRLGSLYLSALGRLLQEPLP